jgi:pyruvate dehydrogenase E2 component (dihydrolipoamide acetyltransferase)
MALALRDYPDVNAQWNVSSIKKFKHADIGVAVATDGGLITPIVFRAESLGLIDIAKRTKDVAKRAREGKLDPSEYIGGTSTISNIGMYGVDSVTSVINPPQSTILGVGQTEKKIIFNAASSDSEKPYK